MGQTRPRLALLGLAAAADVVAADCRFNYWIATEVKKRVDLSEEWWMRLLENGEANENRCRAAMAAFAGGGSLEVLCNELEAVAAFLNNRSL
jgi:hypothetical protein